MRIPTTNAITPAGRYAFFPRGRVGWGLAILAGITVVMIALLYFGIGHTKASTKKASEITVVAVTQVKREDLFNEITAPGEFRPYMEVDVHAKVAGFVSRLAVDIGDTVKTGQLIAVLEVPEIKDDLDHAAAAYKRAEADYKDTHLGYTRLLSANRDHPNLIAQQDLDTSEAKDASAEGALAAAKADVEKYQTLVDYTRITAPFDGVITKRYADPGSLIQAGTASSTQAMPLVRISDNLRLRLDFPVSVDYVPGIRVDVPVSVRVDSLGGRTFTSKIARFTHRVNESTRTMTAEMDVDNRTLELIPGMYATVVIKVDQHPHVLVVPVEAVPSGSKKVYVVNSAQRVEEHPIKLGLETPTKYEILSGLKEGDRVVIGNSSQLRVGQHVETKLTEPLARE